MVGIKKIGIIYEDNNNEEYFLYSDNVKYGNLTFETNVLGETILDITVNGSDVYIREHYPTEKISKEEFLELLGE